MSDQLDTDNKRKETEGDASPRVSEVHRLDTDGRVELVLIASKKCRAKLAASAIETLVELNCEVTDVVAGQVLEIGCRRVDALFKSTLCDAGLTLEDEAFGIEMGNMRSYASHCIDEWRHAKVSAATGATDVSSHCRFTAAASSRETLNDDTRIWQRQEKDDEEALVCARNHHL